MVSLNTPCSSYVFISLCISFLLITDAVQEPRILSVRITYLVVFTCSLLVFNYYTSSIVSSLLSPPTKAEVEFEDLVYGSLTMIFEDIGYTRSLFEVL